MNDVIAPRCDFDSIRADYVIIFGQARRQGAMVLSFTVPDLAAINPLGVTFRERVTKLNDIIRTEAERHGVVVMDFEQYPVAQDPRLWFADRLHGNELGHQKVAAALAWRLGIDGFDEGWAVPLEGEPVRPRGRRAADERHRLGQCTTWRPGWARASEGCGTGAESSASDPFPNPGLKVAEIDRVDRGVDQFLR